MAAERVEHIPCEGRPVDPERMIVIEVVDDPDRPPGTVAQGAAERLHLEGPAAPLRGSAGGQRLQRRQPRRSLRGGGRRGIRRPRPRRRRRRRHRSPTTRTRTATPTWTSSPAAARPADLIRIEPDRPAEGSRHGPTRRSSASTWERPTARWPSSATAGPSSCRGGRRPDPAVGRRPGPAGPPAGRQGRAQPVRPRAGTDHPVDQAEDGPGGRRSRWATRNTRRRKSRRSSCGRSSTGPRRRWATRSRRR